MVRNRYVGVMFPEREIAAIKPAYDHLRDLQNKCHPTTEDYRAIQAACVALQDLARRLAQDQYVWGGRPHGQTYMGKSPKAS